jgi:hypothetical protein
MLLLFWHRAKTASTREYRPECEDTAQGVPGMVDLLIAAESLWLLADSYDTRVGFKAIQTRPHGSS